METLIQDIHYASRTLRRNPGFTAVAVLTLALGIGANTAVFTVVNAALLRPLPYREPDRLLALWEYQTQRLEGRDDVSPGNFVQWRSQNRTFEGLAAYTAAAFNLTGRGEPERLTGHQVSAQFLDVVGARFAAGRGFKREDEAPGAPRVAVLSYSLWQRRFGGNTTLPGNPILLNDVPYEVIGVTAADFRFPGSESDILAPLVIDARFSANHEDHFLGVLGRLKPETTEAQAAADMGVVSKLLERSHPATNRRIGVKFLSIRDQIAGDFRSRLLLLLSAVGCVLLIACANLASLLLARASARTHEIAVRVALGATRKRIVSQLLTESVALALVGGSLGVGVGLAACRIFQQAYPQGMGLQGGLTLDARVVAFNFAISFICGILFGLAPAIQTSVPTAESLKSSGRGTFGEHGGKRFRSALVVGEVALTIVLLSAGGLLLRSFARLRSTDPGFDASQTLTLRLALSSRRYPNAVTRAAGYEQILDRVTALPGVRSAGVTTFLPLTFSGLNNIFTVNGATAPLPGEEPTALMRVVSSDYFRAMRIPIAKGRPFGSPDRETSDPVAIVSAGLARQYWPGGLAVGQRIRFGRAAAGGRWMTIVGVVGNVRQTTLDTSASPAIYVPLRQAPGFIFAAPRDLVVRALVNPAALAQPVVAAIRQVDPDVPVTDVRGLDKILDAAVAQRRVYRDLFAVFGALALAVAAIGVYGITTYTVARRTAEIGIRVALGAQRRAVIVLILGQAVAVSAGGIAIGLAIACFSNQLLRKQLYGTTPTDVATLVGASLVITVMAVSAAYLPARRAAAIDPVKALRAQ